MELNFFTSLVFDCELMTVIPWKLDLLSQRNSISCVFLTPSLVLRVTTSVYFSFKWNGMKINRLNLEICVHLDICRNLSEGFFLYAIEGELKGGERKREIMFLDEIIFLILICHQSIFRHPLICQQFIFYISFRFLSDTISIETSFPRQPFALITPLFNIFIIVLLFFEE